MKMRGAIFDLDGTLLDSMPVWENFGALYLESRGVNAPEHLSETLKAMSLPEAAAYFRKSFGFTEPEAVMVTQFGDMLTKEYRERVELKPHALPFLQMLQRRGVKMCVATATAREAAEAALRRLGIWDYFAFMITCADAGCGKESPEIYLLALDRLGTIKAETVVFEDALHAARTAKAAGFPVIGVFDASSAGDLAELSDIADQYINSFEEWEPESDV